jgi:hypothetical protein
MQVPVVQTAIGIPQNKIPPFRQEIIAGWILLFGRRIVDGEEKVEIGVHQFGIFYTARAFATGILLLVTGARYVLSIRNRQGKCACPFGTEKQLGMADPLVLNRLNEPVFKSWLTDNFAEEQNGMV